MINTSKKIINKILKFKNYEIKKIKKKKLKIVYLKKPINTYEQLVKLLFYRDQKIVFKIPFEKCILGVGFVCLENDNPYSLYLKKKIKISSKIFIKILDQII